MAGIAEIVRHARAGATPKLEGTRAADKPKKWGRSRPSLCFVPVHLRALLVDHVLDS